VNFLVLFAVLLVFCPAVLYAEEQAVSVKEAIQLALERNNLLKAVAYQHAAAEHAVAISRSRYLPRLFLEESFTAGNVPTRVFMMKLDQGRFSQNDFLLNNLNNPDVATDFRTAITLEVPLYNAAIGTAAALAVKDAEGQALALARQREELAFAVFAACLEVRRTKALHAATELALRGAEEHVRLTRTRSGVGVGLQSDVLRAGTFLAEMEQQQITARHNLQLAGMRLALLAGAPAGVIFVVRDDQADVSLGLDQETLQPLALANRLELRELATAVAKARIGVRQAERSFLPTLYGSATYQLHDQQVPFGRDHDSWLAGASLRWELFDGLRRFDERARAQALERSTGELLTEHEREVTFQVSESLLRREEAVQRLAVAKAALRHAEEGLRLITKRFANSLATLVEVLDAQTALNRARATLVESESDHARANAQVWYRAGIFYREVMK
jgi:outer membrane protein